MDDPDLLLQKRGIGATLSLPDATLTSTTSGGGALSVVRDGTPAPYALRRVDAGVNATVVGSGNTVVASCAPTALVDVGGTTGWSPVYDATGCLIRRVATGNGMSLDGDSDPTQLVLSWAADLGSIVGGGLSLVYDAPSRSVCRLDAGTNFTIDASSDPTRLILSGPATTLADATTTGKSVVRSAANRTLVRLDAGPPGGVLSNISRTPSSVTLDATTDPDRIVIGSPQAQNVGVLCLPVRMLARSIWTF